MTLRIFLFLIVSTGVIVSQNNINLKKFNSSNGLPSDVVYQITEDINGYIWMCTDKGVVKYNGTSFQLFQNNNGLPSNDVFGIKTDIQNSYSSFS